MSNLIKNLYYCYFESDYQIDDTKLSKFHTHFHNYYEILILVKGKIKVVTQNNIFLMQDNEILVIEPLIYHKVITPDGSDYKRIIINFSLEENCKKQIERLKKITYIHAESDQNLLDFIQRFQYYYTTFSKEDFLFLARGLTSELLLLLCEHASQETRVIKSNLKPLIKQILDYIDANINKKITLKSLASYFKLTPNYISIKFKNEINTPIITYIKDKKMIKAHNMIKNGENPTQIYYKLGFSDYSNFYRYYLNFFGYPPSKKSDLSEPNHKESS